MNGRACSRWTVFEYMKNRYRLAGNIPERDELEQEFEGIEKEELDEGIAEFEALLGIGGQR
ncbi:hypothetical protein [Paenibacillus agilis]|uniref:Uncharacterized protein n=1 Tax=Paenibacillus agilis TaxID=3020863 RepID=A0A559IZI5_9BACL|nr:hypothetical protein [Paenibacillus agilis]TVX93023.1 hypothetical protein FPZ44_08100 [Paenibacillus agilis]